MSGLYRSRHGILAGVATGVAERTGIHPFLVRALWVASVPVTLFGSVLLYGLLAVILPVDPEAGAVSRPGVESLARQTFGVFWALHGVAHIVGFAVAWGLIVSESEPYTTAILGGRIDIGDGGMRILGLVWLAMVPLFGLAAAAIIRNARVAVRFLGLSAAASLVVCLLQLPAAVVGLWIDVAALVLLAAVVTRTGLARASAPAAGR